MALQQAMKSMKVMKKKAVSKVARGKGAKSKVFHGKKEKTASGLRKSDLMVNKRGKVVSKKAHARSTQRFESGTTIRAWVDALVAARKELNIKGFCSINGNTAQGKALYIKAKSIYAA